MKACFYIAESSYILYKDSENYWIMQIKPYLSSINMQQPYTSYTLQTLH